MVSATYLNFQVMYLYHQVTDPCCDFVNIICLCMVYIVWNNIIQHKKEIASCIGVIEKYSGEAHNQE